jgi:DNA-binding NtrC family response regulator
MEDSFLERLFSYNWPGNVRELENVIERCVILSEGSLLKAKDLDRILTKSPTPSNVGAETLEENERSHILRVLRQTGGKIAGRGGAAEILAIRPTTLHSRMKKLGIQRHMDSSIKMRKDT